MKASTRRKKECLRTERYAVSAGCRNAGSLLIGVLLAVTPIASAAADSPSAAWEALAQGGHVALIRHALAPGIGDPPDFALERCETQRNLSAQGRQQARALGEAFRERDIEIAAVYSSRWCRSLDTARLLDLGDVVPTPSLDSFFRDRSDADEQTARTRQLIAAWDRQATLVMVTHQVNISALTNSGVGSGDIVVVRPSGDRLDVVGRIR
ncbi:histidine phosphatase family protein [Halomonas sp. TRM85114]|nr:histidine phosphatase family protein [Halomonas jincaotanensis]